MADVEYIPLHVTVLPVDIAQGARCCAFECAIAKAVTRAVQGLAGQDGPDFYAGVGSTIVIYSDGVPVFLAAHSSTSKHAMHHFDRGGTVRPFSFDLRLREPDEDESADLEPW